MLSKQEVVSLWEGTIIEYPPNVVSELALPQSSRVFLQNVGLPSKAELEVSFSSEIVTLEEFAGQGNLAHTHDGATLYRIGTDGGTQICLKQGSGDVVSVDPTGELPSRFVNSSIEAFIECLGLFAKHRGSIGALSDNEIDELVTAFEAAIRKVDGCALADEENWWALILEQMYDGLL